MTVTLIALTFLGSTMQARIDGTSDTNKGSYLKAIADRIVMGAGSPSDWGKNLTLPSDLGLASSSYSGTYDLDIDKISRLNNLNNNSLSYIEMGDAAKLTDIAFAISVSQVMSINLEQSANNTVNGLTYFNFTVSTSINSKLVNAELHGYIVARDFVDSFNCTADSGSGTFNVQIPSARTDDALLVVFARANFDDRVTSYAIYNFADSKEKSSPDSAALALSPLNYALYFNDSADITIQNAYAFSYSYNQTIASKGNSQYSIPNFLDRSPLVLVVSASVNGASTQSWVAYPQIPLTSGSNFEGSQRNVFSYMVTVDGVLYRLEISLGGLPP